MSLIDFSKFVNKLADVSGQAILPFFRASFTQTENKSKEGLFDPVTEADRAAEAAMRQLIKQTFPAHGIVGEEFGTHQDDAEYVWVLDPIDGTRAFMAGLPTWGTLIGLKRNGCAVYGMMHQPFTNERFFGDCGSAFYQGPSGNRSLRTRRCLKLSEAIISTTSPRLFKPEMRAAYETLEDQVKFARYGCDCYAYCMVAGGHIDAVIESGLKTHDIIALIALIEGAGGIVTSWDGKTAYEGGDVVAAGDKRLHAAILEHLQKNSA